MTEVVIGGESVVKHLCDSEVFSGAEEVEEGRRAHPEHRPCPSLWHLTSPERARLGGREGEDRVQGEDRREKVAEEKAEEVMEVDTSQKEDEENRKKAAESKGDEKEEVVNKSSKKKTEKSESEKSESESGSENKKASKSQICTI